MIVLEDRWESRLTNSKTSDHFHLMMATTPLLSALIHTLSDDVLLYIFTLNADIFDERSQAVLTTRLTSQVCRQWRDLMLDTPSLWAKLINMKELYHVSEHGWWNELTQRTGDAPLSIRVYSSSLGQHFFSPTERTISLEAFFLEFINSNWHRIQKLVVETDFKIDQLFLTRAMVCVPAPQLEEFEADSESLLLESSGDVDQEVQITPIFADHAPMLRRFCLASDVVNHQAPWLGHLHYIELGVAYKICNALSVLSATHNLQHLRIVDVAHEDLSIPHPVVSLSHLRHLYCSGSPLLCATLLDHVEMPFDCSVEIRVNFRGDNKVAKTRPALLSVVNIFTRYVERYLPSHLFNVIHLNYAPYYDTKIHLKVGTMSPDEYPLSLLISLNDQYSPKKASGILNKLAQLDLAGIRKLELHAGDGFSEPPSAAVVASFFSRLLSLDTICIDVHALRALICVQNYTPDSKKLDIFFPFLRVISVQELDLSTRHFELDTFAKFILSRAGDGHPITTLDLTRVGLFNSPPDLDVFAEAKGLKVLYKRSSVPGIFEHTCCSEDPVRHIDPM